MDRRAHLERNAELMAPGMADQVVLVSAGNLMVNPQEKMIDFFRGYFGGSNIWSGAMPSRWW
jgi:hypothetical protein